MVKKLSIHPLFFALSPLLIMLAQNTSPLRLNAILRDGVLWLAGGLLMYFLLWFVTRQPLRAALLASLLLVLFFAYDPVYEIIRGKSLMGITFGKHRFLAPVWAAIVAASGFFILRKLQRPEKLTPFFNITGLVVMGFGLAWVTSNGAWVPALRSAGLLPPPQVEVTYIDVGHATGEEIGVVGDAILLRTSEGKNALIDGGYPNPNVATYLKEHGVDHLDLVVLSHAHDDHSGGLIEVIRTIPIDLYVHNGQTLDSPVYWELQDTISEAKLNTSIARSGDVIPLGSLTFDILSPNEINPNSVNNNSIVMRLLVGKVSFLFTGDTDKLEESRLLAIGSTQPVDILKLAHHGADTSSHPGYIAAIAPEVAIYSAGEGNMYHFPNEVTLETMRAVGADIYGTDINGTIIVRTDGKTYEVIPERGDSQ